MKEEEKKIENPEEEILGKEEAENIEGGAQPIITDVKKDDLEDAGGGLGCDCGC